MRSGSRTEGALHWRLDPEHEAFRGLAWRSALRLGAVLAAIVAAFALAVVSTAQAQSTEARAAAPMLGQAQPAPACPPGQLSQG